MPNLDYLLCLELSKSLWWVVGWVGVKVDFSVKLYAQDLDQRLKLAQAEQYLFQKVI